MASATIRLDGRAILLGHADGDVRGYGPKDLRVAAEETRRRGLSPARAREKVVIVAVSFSESFVSTQAFLVGCYIVHPHSQLTVSDIKN